MNIRRITRFTFVLAIAALIVGLSACDQLINLILTPPEEMPPEEMPPAGPEEILIGVVLPQTGEYAAPYGLPMLDGFKLAREHINDSGMLGDAKITFIIGDNQSTAEYTVEAVNKLIDRGDVSAITGFALSTYLEEVIPTADEKEIVFFSSVSSKPGLSGRSDFIFRAGLTSAVLNPPLVRATLKEFNYQRAATIYQEGDAYSTSSDEEFRTALAENGIDVVITEKFQGQGDDTDFSAQLTRIMESNPDAIFISALGDHIPNIMVDARQLMPSVHIIVPELTRIEVEAAGDAAEGVPTAIGWFSMTDTPMNQDFVRNYTEKNMMEPVAWAAQSYATLHILAAAIAEAQSTDAMAIRKALAQTMDFDTVLGKFSFDANGEAVYDPVILTVKNGKFEAFE